MPLSGRINLHSKTEWRAAGNDMTIKVDHISAFLDHQAPPTTKLDFDNIGLLLGNGSQNISTILCCLDVTPEVIDEARRLNAELIVAHHPLIFKKLSRINTATEEGKMISDLLKNDIAVFAAHTNYDIANDGVSFIMAERLGLSNTGFLQPMQESDCMLEITSEPEAADHIQNILDRFGDSIAYSSSAAGQAHFRVVTQKYLLNELDGALKSSANQVNSWSYSVTQDQPSHGLGVIGELDSPMNAGQFLDFLKDIFKCEHISYSGRPDNIKRVALCGGAGAPLISSALNKADAYVTADLKYHEFFTGKNDFLLADIGHYESEIPAVEELAERISRRFPEQAVHVTSVNTNPIKHH